MSTYRRNRIAGATYFFTVNLADRRSALLTTRIDALRQAVREARARLPFHIDGWIVLPDHMHCLWTLPEGTTDFSARMQAIKAAFSSAMPRQSDRRQSLLRRREAGIWQRRFWEHTIQDERDYVAHLDYIHFNPVRHGHAASPGGWPFSTFHHCVDLGLYAPDWAGRDAPLETAPER